MLIIDRLVVLTMAEASTKGYLVVGSVAIDIVSGSLDLMVCCLSTLLFLVITKTCDVTGRLTRALLRPEVRGTGFSHDTSFRCTGSLAPLSVWLVSLVRRLFTTRVIMVEQMGGRLRFSWT